MSGALKTVIDRCYEESAKSSWEGKDLYFFMQGAAPTELSKESTTYIIERFAAQMNMNLKGTATNEEELETLKTMISAKA